MADNFTWADYDAQRGPSQPPQLGEPEPPPDWCSDPGYYESQEGELQGERPNVRSGKRSKLTDEPLVLNPAAPLKNARAFIQQTFTQGALRTVHHQNSEVAPVSWTSERLRPRSPRWP